MLKIHHQIKMKQQIKYPNSQQKASQKKLFLNVVFAVLNM
jgi:hypothetical protein